MNIIFALFSRIIALGLFLAGGILLLTKIFGSSKNLKSLEKSNKAKELDEFLNPQSAQSRTENIEAINARARFEADMRHSKEKSREQQKRFKRVDWAWKIASLGSGLLVGGFALEAANNPIGPIGLGILVAAIVGWIGALINNYISDKAIKSAAASVPPRETINAPKLTESGLPNGRSELVNGVLNEAATALNQLDEIIPRLRHTSSIASVAQIVTVGKRLMNHIAANPEKFAIAQRVFTYYCPQTVGVAEALAVLENDSKLDIGRISSTQSILQKLSILFEKTELELKEDDNKSLDIDLKLLDQSLQADLTSV